MPRINWVGKKIKSRLLTRAAQKRGSVKLLLILSVAAPLLAQDGDQQLLTRPPVLQLTLRHAVELALTPEGSTRVKLAEEDLKQAESRS